MQVSKRSQGSPHQSCSQPLSCIPAHSGVFCVCSRQTKAVNLALTALKRSTRWWRIYNIMYTPGVLHECYSAMPEHGSEEKTACKAATQCCKGVSGSLAVSTALWHVWAKHSSLPLSLTQRWVKDLQCCVQMGHNTVWWQHNTGSEHRRDDWCKQGWQNGEWENRTWKALSILGSFVPNFHLHWEGSFFFLIIASTEHISWLFGVVQSGNCSHWKLDCLEMGKSVWRKPPFCFSLMALFVRHWQCSLPCAQHPCLEGRRTLVKSGTGLSSWLQRNKSSRRHCCQEQRGHGASQLSPSEWSSLFTHLLPSMLIGAPDIPPSLCLSLKSPRDANAIPSPLQHEQEALFWTWFSRKPHSNN